MSGQAPSPQSDMDRPYLERNASTSSSSSGSPVSRLTLPDRIMNQHGDERYDLSSYDHPAEIPRPENTYTGPRAPLPRSPIPQAAANDSKVSLQEIEQEIGLQKKHEQSKRRRRRQQEDRGLLSAILDHDADNNWEDLDNHSLSDDPPIGDEPMDNLYEQVLDPDDPRVTGERRDSLGSRGSDGSRGYDDYSEEEEEADKPGLKEVEHIVSSELQRNVCSLIRRQQFLVHLAEALMTFGAPSHRVEAQLIGAARSLEVNAQFIDVPGVILCLFIDEHLIATETHFIRATARPALGHLEAVHSIFRRVVHDKLSVKEADKQLKELLAAKPIYSPAVQLCISFWMAALICPIAFGGSIIDMWLAGLFAVFLNLMRVGAIGRSKARFTQVYEVCLTIVLSFIARALGSIHDSQIFCYNAIASACIVGILPGFLILSGSLELASKNIAAGAIKITYALIFTLFLGFGLQLGSEIYLAADSSARHALDDTTNRLYPGLDIVGSFLPDNGTFKFTNGGSVVNGTFMFYDMQRPNMNEHVVQACVRRQDSAWYFQSFPWWSLFITVPLYTVLSPFSNLQPFWRWDFLVMVLISCVSYALNTVVNFLVDQRSDLVSFIGSVSVGIMGHIYARCAGGTAFPVMVTGALFLVPIGLSAAGGISAQGSGIDVGAAMLSVAIGIATGMYVSLGLISALSKRHDSVFSF